MDGVARLAGQRQWLARMLVSGIISLTLFGVLVPTAPSATAAGWNTSSVIRCGYLTGGGYETLGYSDLFWNGYFYASSGETYGTMWRWGGSGWLVVHL